MPGAIQVTLKRTFCDLPPYPSLTRRGSSWGDRLLQQQHPPLRDV